MGVTKPVASRKVQPIAGPSPRTGRPALQSTQTKKGNDARVKDETQVQIVTRDPRSINEHVKVGLSFSFNYENLLVATIIYYQSYLMCCLHHGAWVYSGFKPQ
jgi:hypothetical protein